MLRKAVVTACMLALFASHSIAQSGSSQKMTIQAGYGTVTMGGVQWQRFSFRPDIPIGSVGVGLDLELFIDAEGKISDEGWNFSNKNQVWDSLIRKIYYVRYGQPFDRLYVRAGALDDVTLGYGLVMDDYRNTLNYPAEKKLGVDFELRDIGTFGIDLHAMVNSVGDLKNNGAVTGGRIAVKPLNATDIRLLNRLTFGATFVRDINQFAGLKDSDDDGYPDFQDGFVDDKKRWADSDGDGFEDDIDIDVDGDNILDTNDPDPARQDYISIEESRNGVSVYGFDVGAPLIENALRLDLYGQYSKLYRGDDDADGGWGIGAPGLRLLVGRFKGQIEYRHFEGPYRPNYFNNLYEHERVRLVGTSPITKEQALIDETLNGFYGRAGYSLLDLAEANASYQHMTGDRTFKDLTGSVKLLDNTLKMIPKISLAEAYFFNTYVDPDQYDIWEFTPNTFYGTRIGFEVTPGMIIVWDTRYTFSPNGRGGLDKNRFVSIETVMNVK